MGTAVINIRTDAKVKSQAQKIAAELGISLSALINGFIRNLVRTKRVEFDLNPKGVDSYTKEVIREAIKYYSKKDQS